MTGTEKNKHGNVAKAGAVIGDTFYEDIFEKVTKTGERTGKEAKLDGRENKINAKYDAELKELEQQPTTSTQSTELSLTPEQQALKDKISRKKAQEFENEYDVEEDENINYNLKVVNALTDISRIRQTIRLNSKDKPYVETNLRKLLRGNSVTDQQIDLVFDYMRSNNLQEISTIDLIMNIASVFSFTMKIDSDLTDYYENLSVPGGTNYKENEISTPLITPSIKGHAQFATPNGIGWFRSDVQALNQQTLNSLNQRRFTSEQLEMAMINTDGSREALDAYLLKNYPDRTEGTATKTRRILEIQSDLFQKSRDKKDLVQKPERKNITFGDTEYGESFVINDVVYEYDSVYKTYSKSLNNKSFESITKSEYNKAKEKYNPEPINKQQNQFLQLLNKNNNWVTFFIKSIVQDSAKRGYEKVLFPSGDTASKVEGHTTLEEFKKQKENRIKELEKEKNIYHLALILDKSDSGILDSFPTKEEALIAINRNNKEIQELDSSSELTYELREKNLNLNEINQLKQELERVETEGFGALAPIYNFYETTVTNILNKIYGEKNVKKITDEYGNTWNEITIDQERDSSYINLYDETEAIPPEEIAQRNIVAQSLLIDGLDSIEQSELIDHFVGKIATLALSKQGRNKVATDAEINQIYDDFLKDLTNSYVNNNAIFGINSNERAIAERKIMAVAENIEFIKEQVKSQLTKIIGGETKENDDLEFDTENDTLERTNYSDGYTFLLNPKDTAGTNLKLWLMQRKKKDKNGEEIVTKFTENTLIDLSINLPFDKAFEVLSEIAAGYSSDWDTMMEALTQAQHNHDWLPSLVQEIKDIKDEQLKNQFLVAMTKRRTEMLKAAFKVKNITDNTRQFIFSVIDENSNSVTQSTLSKWQNGLLNNDKLFVYDEEGESTLNIEYLKELETRINDIVVKGIKDYSSIQYEEVRDLLNEFGINITKKIFNKLSVPNSSLTESNRQLFRRYRQQKLEIFNIVKLFQSNGPFSANVLIKPLLNQDNVTDEYTLFKNEPALFEMAKWMGLHDESLFSNSFRIGEKTLYSYKLNTLISERIEELKDPNYAKQLISLPYNKYNGYLKYLYENENDQFKLDDNGLPILRKDAGTFIEIFKVSDISLEALKEIGSNRRGGAINELDEGTHEYAKIILFQKSRLLKEINRRVGNIVMPTFSDKSSALTLQTYLENISLNEDGSLSPETLNLMYSRMVLPEVSRIRAYQLSNESSKIKGYDDGAQLFYAIPELNDRTKYAGLWDRGVLLPVLSTNRHLYDQAIQEHFKKVIDNKVENWKENKLAEKLGTKYLKDLKSKLPRNIADNAEALLRAAAADFELNYAIVTADNFSAFHGDPALYFKTDSKALVTRVRNNETLSIEEYNTLVRDTFTNVGKRLAADIAPGQNLAGDVHTSFNLALLPDIVKDSLSLPYYAKLKIQGYNQYSDIEGTDAQEYTTFKEHINVLYKLGRLSEEEYNRVLEKYINWTAKEKRGEQLTEADYVSKEDLTVLLQPLKPVYTNNIESNGVFRRLYVKSSSIPLIPQLTKGLQIDKLRKALERDNIDRAAFGSAFKVGAPTSSVGKMWNDDGTINEAELMFRNSDGTPGLSVLENVPRRGFRIQQEIPSKAEEVNVGTQERKLLFTDIINVPGIAALKDIYLDTWDKLFALKRQELYDEILDNRGKLNLEKLSKTLVKEAKSRNWPINDQFALEVMNNDFTIPPWSLHTRSKIEALLNSIVDNKIRKIKFPGKSFVLVSEEGFSALSGNNIHDTGIRFNEHWSGSLKHLGDDKQYTDIIVPWKFKNANGDYLNIEKYIDKETGILQTDKIGNADLVRMFGFRIPTQGLNSMANMRVVGYLPPQMGDIVIASRDFTRQMGSDFDIDKLYSYRKYYYENRNGKLVVINNDTNIADIPTSMHSKFEEMKLVNQIIDIHYQVLDNPDPEIQKRIAEPLSFQELKKMDADGNDIGIAKRYEDLKNQNKENQLLAPFSSSYQRDKLISASAGKIGIGVFSLDSVFNSMIQNNDIYIDNMYLKLFGLEFTGDLSDPQTLSRNGRTKGEVISGYQSASVDNEKERILEKLNINKNTFPFIRAMNQMGYEENHTGAILNQPIIIDAIKLMNRFSSVISENRLSGDQLENFITDILMKDYAIEPLFEEDNLLSRISVEKLEETMTGDESLPNFKQIQFEALETFFEVSKIGRRIQTLQGLMNTDSAGIGKNLIYTFTKYQQIPEVLKKPFTFRENFVRIPNIRKLIDPYSNSKEFSALSNKYVLKTAYDIFTQLTEEGNKLFPYDSETFKIAVTQISEVSEEDIDRGLTSKAENRARIFDHLMSYLYSNPNHGFTSNFNKYLNQKEVESLGAKILKLKKDPVLKHNKFISRLEVKTGKLNQPTLIEINATKEESTEELNIHLAFLDLLYNDRKIGDLSSSEIIKELIEYSYVTGGHQRSSQINRFIPVTYLNEQGLTQRLKSIDWSNETRLLNSQGFQITPKTPFYQAINGFTVQYFQHSPWMLSELDPSYDPKLSIQPIVGEDYAKTLVSHRDIKSNTWAVFLKTEVDGQLVYVKLTSLGSDQIREYNAAKPMQNTTVFGKKIGPTVVPKINPKINKTEPTIPVAKTIPSNYGLEDGANINNILLNIISSDELDSETKQLAEDLYELGFDEEQISIIIDNEVKGYAVTNTLHSKTDAEPYSDRISVNIQRIATRFSKTKNEKLAEILLHEIGHVATARTVHKYYTNADSVSKDSQKAIQRLEQLQEKLQSYYKDNEAELVKQFSEQDISDIRRAVFGGKVNYDRSTKTASAINELIVMARSNAAVRKYLNETVWQGDKSFHQRLLELLERLFESIGLNKNLAGIIYNESMTLAGDNQEVFVQNKVSDNKTESKGWARYSKNGFEVSSAGDKRFSAVYAKLKDGRTIEEAYQLDIKGYRIQGNDWKLGKNKPPLINISKEESWLQYKELWRTYLNENPELLQDLKDKSKGKILTDQFAKTEVSQARALAEILREKPIETSSSKDPNLGYTNEELKEIFNDPSYLKDLESDIDNTPDLDFGDFEDMYDMADPEQRRKQVEVETKYGARRKDTSIIRHVKYESAWNHAERIRKKVGNQYRVTVGKAMGEKGDNRVYFTVNMNAHPKQDYYDESSNRIDSKIDELLNSGEIKYVNEEGKPCAEMGLKTSNFQKGGKWKLIKDLKGYPTHKQGGVDLNISKSGVFIKNGSNNIKAKYGLVISNKDI